MKPSTAFVAMKFDSDHWRDKRYLTICEILKEAGYDPIRSDQIKTSGPVVGEVCRYLEEAPLVLIDSSGDSHSVSYEIGYCHGCKRTSDTTLLLRCGSEIPFNYRHFRHTCYRDLKHLRRLLREWLSLSIPLQNGHYGYTFTFELTPGASDYGATVADCVLKALGDFKHNGRAEFFAANDTFYNMSFYKVGLGLKLTGKKLVPDYKWWKKFGKYLIAEVEAQHCGLKHADTMSEMSQIGAMRQTMRSSGIAQFENGLPIRLIGGDASESWFRTALKAAIKEPN